MTGPTAEQPQVTATVSPAGPPRTRWGAIPRHLGRARTATVVLSLLVLAVGTLWINIRPDPDRVPAGTGSVVEQPSVPIVPLPTPTPTEQPEPTTEPEPTSASEEPTTSSSDVPTPTETGTRFPTSTPTSEPPAPLPSTTSTPPG